MTDSPQEETLTDVTGLTVGVLGGTGPQGKGLALRWATAGIKVIIGSRSAERAEAAAAELGDGVTGMDNQDTAAMADVVLVAVPWEGHGELLTSLRDRLAGKIVIDCVNPLGFDKQGPFALAVEEGSAAQQAEQLLPESRVTAAFHHVSAVHLADLSITELRTDVLVLGDDREATDLVRALADAVPGIRGVYGGRLRNAHQVEALTANLIAINRRHKAHAGIRITDV
ncbi:NADPH-dependent F420 reductase [Nonomuraea guangzhouensis]|uniref:NADPH-dependent F420 reductase n=1 Tax=Nonomuraea guangzhouensis TaxID=1291555 RepID=A0ABW4GTQ9_9ACTN|nr:NADPH-dependent F420 reductase [Nonomuraea guangzhouensis]